MTDKQIKAAQKHSGAVHRALIRRYETKSGLLINHYWDGSLVAFDAEGNTIEDSYIL